ncbi:hypothetical protein OYC64_015222 [Pagothenia borchgrevinki]|uniref:Uncharacterized protein n=1 Tax=Pagothenia borchgrevinki TaxID=8213 RepID=A0ABD2H519_PAGBO
MRFTQQTAESEQAAMTLAQQTAESERAALRLELQQYLDTQLDTSAYQPRRRLFGFHVGDADPQPLQPDVPIPAAPILAVPAANPAVTPGSAATPRPSATPDAPNAIRAVSSDREDMFFEDCYQKGQRRPEKFAGDMFMAMLPFETYENMVKITNWSGSKGKMPLPLNVRQTLKSSVSRRFPGLTTDQWHKIRNRVNERLRSQRKTDPETPRPGFRRR